MFIKTIISIVVFAAGLCIAWKGADKGKLWVVLVGVAIVVIGFLGIITYAT